MREFRCIFNKMILVDVIGMNIDEKVLMKLDHVYVPINIIKVMFNGLI